MEKTFLFLMMVIGCLQMIQIKAHYSTYFTYPIKPIHFESIPVEKENETPELKNNFELITSESKTENKFGFLDRLMSMYAIRGQDKQRFRSSNETIIANRIFFYIYRNKMPKIRIGK
jgi:hypothetical protein